MSTMESRKKYVQNLGKYLEDAAKTFQGFMKSLRWSTEHLLEEFQGKELVKCPLNAGHYVPLAVLDKHVDTCSWLQDGYTKEEKEKTNSSCFFYQNSTTAVPVLIDKKTQAQILQTVANRQYSNMLPGDVEKDLPRTMDRAMTELTAAERLAIYEYVVKKGDDTNKERAIQLEDLQLSFEKKGSDSRKRKSLLEMMAEERDYKRRRQSYRAKNVHITKKSYTEVMREVIENQMDMLKHMRETEAGEVSNTESQTLDEAAVESKPSSTHSPERNKHRQTHDSKSSPTPERDELRKSSHRDGHSTSRRGHQKQKKRRRSHHRSDEDSSHEKRHKRRRKKHRHRKSKSRRRHRRSRSSTTTTSSSSHSSSTDES